MTGNCYNLQYINLTFMVDLSAHILFSLVMKKIPQFVVRVVMSQFIINTDNISFPKVKLPVQCSSCTYICSLNLDMSRFHVM